MTVDLLKENGINVDCGLELLGDLDLYNETLGDFLEEAESRLPKMEAYLKNNDMPNYAILAHSHKSDSKYLGFTKLAELSYQHEMESKANNVSFIQAHYQELVDETNRIVEIVQKYLGRL